MEHNLNSDFQMHYWDFMYAIEFDLKTLSRYIELNDNNLNTYSIELVRLYLSTCSEIEVVLKEFCKILNDSSEPRNITQYRNIIKPERPQMLDEIVNIGFKKTVTPWVDWKKDTTPKWWKDYQLVKHSRNEYYHLATLENVLHSVGALFLCVHFYYLEYLSQIPKSILPRELSLKDITSIFNSGNNFLKLASKHQQGFLSI
ncbi:hypothetical protein M0G43_01690 [Subsaxibacter sp. CAU 1640]|uniref:hypothetical protein n=1 Tax=Subsaxibacter sp. CAU 1640 TaxID=2933271 RepID=UPI002004E8D8|nr:hypothetical protein [Subsaxibacter sp. CAU 1640]MCK7589277.1 hypothetical protein [Subsaxibacter sp. CAU 1640]